MSSPLPRPLSEAEREEMHRVIIEILGEKKAKLWWTAKNPMLGDISPQTFMRMGLERRVYQFVMNAHELNQPPPGRSP